MASRASLAQPAGPEDKCVCEGGVCAPPQPSTSSVYTLSPFNMLIRLLVFSWPTRNRGIPVMTMSAPGARTFMLPNLRPTITHCSTGAYGLPSVHSRRLTCKQLKYAKKCSSLLFSIIDLNWLWVPFPLPSKENFQKPKLLSPPLLG